MKSGARSWYFGIASLFLTCEACLHTWLFGTIEPYWFVVFFGQLLLAVILGSLAIRFHSTWWVVSVVLAAVTFAVFAASLAA